MFFVLAKLLSLFTKPIVWLVILAIISIITKREKLKKWTKRSAIIGLFFFSNTVIFLEFTRLWETEGTEIESIHKTYDFAIVLGGMAEYDNNLKRLSLRRGGDRIWQSLHLYYSGIADKLLICGSNGFLMDNPLNEAAQFKEELINFGIPEEDILVDKTSKNTYQNAVEAKEIISSVKPNAKIILVTSALHMRRSRACFSKVGFSNFDCFTTDHYTGSKRGYSWDQFIIPNFSVLLDWNKLTHEWVGYISYSIMGYV